MEFNGRYLAKFIKDGTLSKQDLIRFYTGDDIRDRFRAIDQEIRELGEPAR